MFQTAVLNNTLLSAESIESREQEEVELALVGVPFDLGTSMRTGSRLGPTAVRAISGAIRPYNRALGFSPFDLASIADFGDIDTGAFDKTKGMQAIESAVRSLVKQGIAPVSVGGDHSIALPLLRAVRKDQPMALVTFDAHHDTYDDLGGDKYCYATPFRRAVEEGLIDPVATVMVGLRNCTNGPGDYTWALEAGIRLISIEEIDANCAGWVSEQVAERVRDLPTYVSFDIDGLDASLCPGTGFPEPNGLTMREATAIIRGLHGQHIIGADLCEVNPTCDVANLTALNAAHLLFELTCLVASSVAAQRKTGEVP